MAEPSRLIDDLDETLAGGSPEARAHLLRRITDLYLDGAVHYADDQIAVFDDVLGRLATDIEETARRELARRLAAAPVPPPRLARTLALDETPAVAAPLLIHAEGLDDADLVACARTRSQAHLLAITKRAVVPTPVTDVLVERGSDLVVRSVADNAGSRFSDAGFDTLVRRADGDDVLATRVGLRPDLPRRHFIRLLAKASEAVRGRLQEGRGGTSGDDIRGIVAQIAEAIAARTAAESKDYTAAIAAAAELDRTGRLGDAEIGAFATAGRFEHTAAALARLADLPLVTVERILLQRRSESLLFLARAVGLGWPTTRAILEMRLGPGGMGDQALAVARSSFDRIRRQTAEQVLAFQRARHDSA
ncbi:DUF2336 domain-containing protein [Rhodoplanes serenus]|uniref:DUF2336 domain-containing protein n=1 Tax=Rhodoplanes serenus TaxID=200615 RepID=UPI00131E1A63|nr:DUF2336 domain-containing protein [Rhodoplanes serenus]